MKYASKKQGKKMRTPRHEHAITRVANLLTAKSVSLKVAGIPIEEQYARYGTAMMLTRYSGKEIRLTARKSKISREFPSKLA